ncbi:hypothetical protein FOZ63_010341 [Perkinsus olseni]|nr:hypothetical protein FOZ63_010341 [Perkinsus olseni]
MLSSLTRSVFPAVQRSMAPLAARGLRSFSSLVFTKDHEWIAPTESDEHVATIGVTDFAQDEIGELV